MRWFPIPYGSSCLVGQSFPLTICKWTKQRQWEEVLQFYSKTLQTIVQDDTLTTRGKD